MICISITPESRTLAKADLLNASRQGDLVELCLDRMMSPIDVRDIINGIETPVLASCRRKQDGGTWEGAEDDRLARLLEASQAGVAYVEVEADCADAFPKVVAPTKLVVSNTSLDKPLGNLDQLFERAVKSRADVIKFTWPTPTLDAMWPLLSTISRKRDIPVVGMGLGRAGVMFSLLGRKYGSPWLYAALEKGMEAHEGQATVGELDDIYAWREISPQTQFVGIVGFGAAKTSTVRMFNNGFRHLELNIRCLPIEIGKFDKLAQMLDVLKINAIFTSRHLGEHILPLAQHREEAASAGRNADLLLKKADGWNAYNNLWRSAIRGLERTLGRSKPDDRPLNGRKVLVFGTGRLAQTLVYGLLQRNGTVAVTGLTDDDDDAIEFCSSCGAAQDAAINGAQQLADQFGVEFLPFAEVQNTPADVVVFADPALEMGFSETELNPSFLRAGMTVMDVRRMPEASDFIVEARLRGCKVVEPADIYVDQVFSQFKAITGENLPNEAMLDVLF